MNEKIAIIGAGKVGEGLAKQWISHGLPILNIIDPDLIKARKCQERYHIEEISNDVSSISSDVTLICIAVPDDHIALVVSALKKRTFHESCIFTHTSGFHTSDLLNPLRENGYKVCSYHPCYSFLSGMPETLENIYFCL